MTPMRKSQEGVVFIFIAVREYRISTRVKINTAMAIGTWQSNTNGSFVSLRNYIVSKYAGKAITEGGQVI